MDGEVFATDGEVTWKPPDPADLFRNEEEDADRGDQETEEDQPFPEGGRHGGHGSVNNESWADVFGTAIPRCFQAAGVATLPRGVRLRKPRWMRNGS